MTDIDVDALEWGYSGPGGPEHWASLAPEYAPCDEGVQQSPIDIAGYEDGDAPALSLSYDGGVSGVELVRGSIVVSFGQGSSLLLAERRYELQSAHAHAPAEHRVDGEEVALAGRLWIRFHKPRGVLTSAGDPHGRATIYDRLPDQYARLPYVGRLDRDTEGLLLLTNDGDLAHRLQHPRWGVEREYVARVQGVPGTDTLERLRRGVELDDGWARPSSVDEGPGEDGSATLTLVLTEGRKREVRRLLEAVGHPVIALKRIRFGPIRLGSLPAGQCDELDHEDIRALERCVEDADLE